MTLFKLPQGRVGRFKYELNSVMKFVRRQRGAIHDGVSSCASKRVRVSRARVPILLFLLWLADRKAAISFPALLNHQRSFTGHSNIVCVL